TTAGRSQFGRRARIVAVGGRSPGPHGTAGCRHRYRPPPVPMAWISPTSTSSVDVRLIAGRVPPPVAFEVQVTSRVTVAWSVNVPFGSPAEDVRYVCVQSLESSGSPARHAVPGPRQETL